MRPMFIKNGETKEDVIKNSRVIKNEIALKAMSATLLAFVISLIALPKKDYGCALLGLIAVMILMMPIVELLYAQKVKKMNRPKEGQLPAA